MTTWVGLLYVLVLILMTVGGFVRLSESGLSLPGWPLNGGRLIPPFSEAGWQAHFELYLDELHRLRELRSEGKTGIGVIPTAPADLAAFKTIYLTEYSHRLLAALSALVGLACLVVLWRNKELRRLAGGPLMSILGLIIVQSIIGGVLVLTGTSTQFLFIHLGMATATLGVILWSLLLLLRGDKAPQPTDLLQARAATKRRTWMVLWFVFAQILLGALVAGSRQHGMSTTWPTMNGEWIPQLWQSSMTMSWNLFDNTYLHQWIHRWFAIVLLAYGLWAWWRNRSDDQLGSRGRLANQLIMSTLVVQVILGIMNVTSGATTLIALTHLFIALLLFSVLVLLLFDIRHEPKLVAETAADAGSAAARQGSGLSPRMEVGT